jgi:drug/metabolite transporter (DMT)-like permease
VDAVLLACLSGALFGAFTVAVRFALRRGAEPEAGAAASSASGLAVALVCAAAAGFPRAGLSLEGLWPFVVAGVVVPGVSQTLFVRAVRAAGPSRTSVLIGAAPLASALLALWLLDEPFRVALAAGTVLVVLGCVALARERARPEHFAVVGLLLAFGAMSLYSLRDVIVRWAAADTDVSPLVAAATSLAAGTATLALTVLLVPSAHRLGSRLRPTLVGFVPAGILLGVAYVTLFEALERGRVTVVAPLNGTQALWAVLLSAAFVGRSEAIGLRLAAAAVLIVAGGALIGATR